VPEGEGVTTTHGGRGIRRITESSMIRPSGVKSHTSKLVLKYQKLSFCCSGESRLKEKAQAGEGESMSNKNIRAKTVRVEGREGKGEWLAASPRIMPKSRELTIVEFHTGGEAEIMQPFQNAPPHGSVRVVEVTKIRVCIPSIFGSKPALPRKGGRVMELVKEFLKKALV